MCNSKKLEFLIYKLLLLRTLPMQCMFTSQSFLILRNKIQQQCMTNAATVPIWKHKSVLQPLQWCCVECVIHHERDVRKEQQYIYMVRTGNNRMIAAHELYCCLLPQCKALCSWRSGFSDHNKVVLWPGCEGRAEFSLHTKNVRSVRSVVKRRGCCCNLSGGVALNVWFTTNGMCTKKNNIYKWHKQAILEWLQRMNSIVACCTVQSLALMPLRLFRSQQVTQVMLVITYFTCTTVISKLLEHYILSRISPFIAIINNSNPQHNTNVYVFLFKQVVLLLCKGTVFWVFLYVSIMFDRITLLSSKPVSTFIRFLLIAGLPIMCCLLGSWECTQL